MNEQNLPWIERFYEACSGCRRCEIACSLFHEGKIWPEASRVRVFMFIPGVEIPHLCFQCENYPCIEACPAKAIYLNVQTGAVKVEVSKCTGCGLCIRACPARVPHMHPVEKHVVICDLCDGNPKCVEACMKGNWNALKLTTRRKGFSSRALAKTPEELTRETAEKLYGKKTAEEAYDW